MFGKLNATFDMIDDAKQRARRSLAANLRRLRIARHLSLSQLSGETSIGKATLSAIENERANPTVETLAALASALRVELAELVEPYPEGEVVVVRGGEAAVARRTPVGPARRLGEVDAGAEAQLWELDLDPAEVRELAAAVDGSRRHVVVLEGRVIAGPDERVTELDAGDYAAFPADVPHRLEGGRRGARLLMLTESP